MFHVFTGIASRFSPSQREIISNTGWLLTSRILRIVVSLLMATLIAKYLQPDRYGKLQYALAFCSFFLPLSTAQMSDVVTRDLVKTPEQKYQILGTAFSVQLVGGIVAAAAAIALSTLLAPSDPSFQFLIAILSLKFILVSTQPIENWFDSKVASKFKVFSTNIAFAVITAIEFTLVIKQAPLFAFAIVTILESLIYGVGLFYFYFQDKQNPLKWKTGWSGVKYLLLESFPLCLSSTSLILYKNIDRVMLGNMIDNQSVGIYSSAATLSESLCFLPTILCVSLYPALIKAKELEVSLYREKLQRIYDLVAFLAYGLILCLVPLSGLIISVLYGESYQAASPILSLYVWSCLFSFLGIAQSRWIVSEGLQKFNFYSRLAGLVTNIVLNLALIPLYRELGAAIATVISYAIGNYFFFFLFSATRGNARLMTKALCVPFRLPKFLKSLV
jgi:polysaccharide transporter, PST family